MRVDIAGLRDAHKEMRYWTVPMSRSSESWIGSWSGFERSLFGVTKNGNCLSRYAWMNRNIIMNHNGCPRISERFGKETSPSTWTQSSPCIAGANQSINHISLKQILLRVIYNLIRRACSCLSPGDVSLHLSEISLPWARLVGITILPSHVRRALQRTFKREKQQ
jgi:hypothetical protein